MRRVGGWGWGSVKPLPASPRWAGGDAARGHNMPPRQFQRGPVSHAPPPCLPAAPWLTASLVHICPLTLCSSLISCSGPHRLGSSFQTWLPLLPLVPSEPGWMGFRTSCSPPASEQTQSNVCTLRICTYCACVCIMCIYLHMLKYDVCSRCLMLTHPSPESLFLLFSLQIQMHYFSGSGRAEPEL